MKKFLSILFVIAAVSAAASAQVKPKPKPTPRKPAAATPAATSKPDIERGIVTGRTYTNYAYGFEFEFPATWLIPGDDFEEYMKKQGFDLSLKAPASLTPSSQAKVNAALKNVTVLLTAYRAMPGTADNAIMRLSAESIAAHPQIKDAVDYIDAVRSTYKTMTLPAGFTYSETQAEQLGTTQFAFIDTTSKEGKKRMYALVRKDLAFLFTLTYSGDEDLVTMRRVLEEGNFQLKTP